MLGATLPQVNLGHPLQQGLQGWWQSHASRGPSTLMPDLSPFGNNGVLTSMDPATDWVASPCGMVLDFDGSNDYVAIPGKRSLQKSTWLVGCKISSISQYEGIIYSRGTHACGMMVSNDVTRLGTTWNGALFADNSGPLITLDVWALAAMVVRTADIMLYWIGPGGIVTSGSVNAFGTPAVQTVDDLKIGTDEFRWVGMQVSFAAIYSREMTQPELSQIWQEWQQGFPTLLNRRQMPVAKAAAAATAFPHYYYAQQRAA